MIDPLFDLELYSPKLLVSQVEAFFAKKNINISKTSIQYYTKLGLIPKPVDGRHYSRKQLEFLVIIDCLKACFSLDEIKMAFDILDDHDDVYIAYLKTVDSVENNINTEFTSKNIENFANMVKSVMKVKQTKEDIRLLNERRSTSN